VGRVVGGHGPSILVRPVHVLGGNARATRETTVSSNSSPIAAAAAVAKPCKENNSEGWPSESQTLSRSALQVIQLGIYNLHISFYRYRPKQSKAGSTCSLSSRSCQPFLSPMFKRTEWVERPPAASTLASTTVPEHPQTASTEASKPPATQSSPSAEVPLPATLPSSYLPLSAQFPTSSPQALLRFATAYPKNNGKDAIAPYKAHLKWRETTFPIIAHDPELFYPREHDKVSQAATSE